MGARSVDFTLYKTPQRKVQWGKVSKYSVITFHDRIISTHTTNSISLYTVLDMAALLGD